MLITRYAKIVMSLVLAAFCLLVTFDNLTDYGTNYLFVQHVMSMDTTFPGNALMYRSITSPLVWQIFYALIIAAEGVTGTLFFAGAIRLFQVRNEPAEAFNQAKIYTIAACLLAFLVWFFGFMVVAGEWFAMWQSTTWNGQEAAFRFYAAVLGVLIFVNQPDTELPGFVPPPPVTPRRRRADKSTKTENPDVREGAEKQLGRSRPAAAEFPEGGDGHCLMQALAARRIAFRYLRDDEVTNPQSTRPVITFLVNGVPYYFDIGLRSANSSLVPGHPVDGQVAHDFVNDKGSVKTFLRANGFQVPEGAVFARDQYDEAEAFFSSFSAAWPAGACVKPTKGRGGKRVYVGVRDAASFRRGFASIAKRFSHILIEETVAGQMCRILCVGGRGVAALSWRTANVEGDGKRTVAELVESKNMERRLNPAYADFPLQLSEEREIAFLRKTGLAVDHVPALGELIYLRDRPNEDEATDITDRIHPSYVTCVERALSLMPPLVWCGADLIIPDIAAPATCENYYILELNTPARFVDHHHPWRGQSRDVASLILDRLESWN